MEVPEIHVPHTRRSGNQWLDMMLGASAFIISLVSLWIGIQHGRAMERLVAANSWPNIEFDSVVDHSGAAAQLRLLLENNGVGPARIESIEIWHHGQAQADVAALARAMGSSHVDAKFTVSGNRITGSVIGARQKQLLVSLTAAEGAHWAATLLRDAGDLQTRVCYCSVFDECYVDDTRDAAPRPQRVDHCPVPAVAFHDERSADELAAMAARVAAP